MFRPTVASSLCFLLCVILSLIVAKPAMGQAKNILTLAEYHQRIQHYIETLERVTEADAPTQVEEIHAELSATESVRYLSGEIVTLSPLFDEDTPVTDVLTRLNLIDTQLTLAADDNNVARLALLTTVLERPVFNLQESLWERLFQWPIELILSLFGENSSGSLSKLVTWTLVILGAILTVFLLSYWLQGLFGNFVSDAERKRRQQSGDAFPLNATDARQQATALAQEGDYRQAVRQLYLSALLALEENHLLHYDRSLTNREVLTQIEEDGLLQQHLQPIVETFDDVWYGIQEPDAQTFSNYQQEIDSLNETAQNDSHNTKHRGGRA